MQYYAIVLAAGLGKRMASNLPKQFLPLAGLPLLMHAIRAFSAHPFKPQVLVVLPPDYQIHWQELCKKYHFKENTIYKIVDGGKTRFHSVRNALHTLPSEGFVAIHDGVRPLISEALITRTFEAATLHQNAIPALPLVDSMHQKHENLSSKSVNRADFSLVQTPQCFDLSLLQKAYQQPYSPAFTDDASVWEQAGNAIYLTQGEQINLKITHPIDLIIAKTLHELELK